MGIRRGQILHMLKGDETHVVLTAEKLPQNIHNKFQWNPSRKTNGPNKAGRTRMVQKLLMSGRLPK